MRLEPTDLEFLVIGLLFGKGLGGKSNACYGDEGSNVEKLVSDVFREEGTMHILHNALGSPVDHHVQRFLEKLRDYLSSSKYPLLKSKLEKLQYTLKINYGLDSSVIEGFPLANPYGRVGDLFPKPYPLTKNFMQMPSVKQFLRKPSIYIKPEIINELEDDFRVNLLVDPINRTSASSFLEYYKCMRDYLEHEDTLVNIRFTWGLTVQGFIIGAFGFTLQKFSDSNISEEYRILLLFFLIGSAVVGLFSSIFSGVAIGATYNAKTQR
jgi:hypothetical protein